MDLNLPMEEAEVVVGERNHPVEDDVEVEV